MNTTLINGQFENKISVQDRGLQYGDGVFRTLVCNRGSIPHFAKHYQKLKQDAKALDVEWGQLLLEQNSWGGYARVEQLAQQQKMQAAPLPDVVMVQP